MRKAFSPFTNHSKLRETNPEAAALRNFLIISMPITFMADFMLFGPYAGFYRGLRTMTSQGRSVRTWSSDLLSLMLTMIQVPLFMLNGWYDDDEENMEKHWLKSLRNTFMGYLPNLTLDFIIGAWFSTYDEDWLYKRFKNQVSTFIPDAKLRIPTIGIMDWLQDD